MGLLSLAIMSGSIFVATLLVGHIPLLFNLSQHRLNQASHFGRGLLIGAGLAIVIPEGTEAMFEHAPEGTEQGKYMAVSLLSGFIFMYLVDSIHDRTESDCSDHKARRSSSASSASHHHRPSPNRARLDEMSSASPLLPQAMHDGQNMPQHLDLDVVQQQPRPSPSRRSTSASHFKGPTSEEDQTIYPPQKEEQPWHSSITLGLVIHSLADGISLGASALASAAVDGVNLSIVVFLAILVHKAPTALGLTSSLLADHHSRSSTQRSLILFSLASPFGALVTYFVISLLGGGGVSGEASDGLLYWAGCSLLFSAGTFLFVATHVIPESHSDSGKHLSNLGRVSLTVGGMAAPFLLQLAVGHSH